MTVKRDRFDFEIGYLVKSPCKECLYRDSLPKCSDECSLLDRIQVFLSRGVSCTGKSPSINF
jgi:hypothetical protein